MDNGIISCDHIFEYYVRDDYDTFICFNNIDIFAIRFFWEILKSRSISIMYFSYSLYERKL